MENFIFCAVRWDNWRNQTIDENARKFLTFSVKYIKITSLSSFMYFSCSVFFVNFNPFNSKQVHAQVNNRNTRKMCEICSNLTIKTPERRQWRNSSVFIINFEHNSQVFLVFLLLTLKMWMFVGLGIHFWFSALGKLWLIIFVPAVAKQLTYLWSVAFHTETSHLIYSSDQITGFYSKCSAGLKWINHFSHHLGADILATSKG